MPEIVGSWRPLLAFDDDRPLLSIKEQHVEPRPISENLLSHFGVRIGHQSIFNVMRMFSDLAAATNASQRSLVVAIDSMTGQVVQELLDTTEHLIMGFAMSPPGSFQQIALVP